MLLSFRNWSRKRSLADYVGCVAASTSLGMTEYAQSMTFTKNIGMLLLAIYLILVGLIGIFGFYFGVIPGIIALLAGIFIILGR